MKVLVDDFIKSTDSDATAGIQAAMDAVSDHAAVNLSPEVVFLAGKEYRISDTILIKYGLRVTADGAEIESDIPHEAPMFQWGDGDHKPWQPVWKGGTVRGNGNTVFKIERANHGVIEDVRVGNGDVGIALDGVDPVQWEIRRCFVSNCRTAGIRAHRANVLRIVGGKIHNKKHNAYGLHVTSSSSVSVDSLDISLCKPGAALFERCSGLSVRSLYTERCGGEELNDNAVVTLKECTGFDFSGCRFVAPHGTVTGNTGLAWGLDIIDCDGGSIHGCMSHTTRKGFARVSGSVEVAISGCVESYFDKRPPRILYTDVAVAGANLLPTVWMPGAELVRGVTREGSIWTFNGGTPEAFFTLDADVDYNAGDRFELAMDVITISDDVTNAPPLVDSDMPVLLAWVQNPSNKGDNNKQDRQTLVPLTAGLSTTYKTAWVPEEAGSKVRIHCGTRRGWRGFRCTILSMVLRRVTLLESVEEDGS